MFDQDRFPGGFYFLDDKASFVFLLQHYIFHTALALALSCFIYTKKVSLTVSRHRCVETVTGSSSPCFFNGFCPLKVIGQIVFVLGANQVYRKQ